MAQNNTIQKVGTKQTLQTMLEGDAFQDSLKAVLPRHLTREKFIKTVLIATSKNPRLMECTRDSFLKAVITSAELGLDCTGTLGQAYLVPFKNGKSGNYECQMIPGYQGLIDLVYRAGQVKYIDAQVVCENDKFRFSLGTNPFIEHEPELDDRGKIRAVYAVAEIDGQKPKIEVMSLSEVKAIQDRSKAKNNGPWVTDFNEMARKTVLRRIIKYLPKSVEIERLIGVLDADNQQYDAIAEETANEAKAGAQGLTERMKKAKQVDSTVSNAPPDEDQNIPDPETGQADAPNDTDGEQATECRFYCTNCDGEFDSLKNGNCPNCITGKHIVDRRPQVEK
jgi:recombination protein RecT